jgi:four helix bundle protein
MADLKRMSIRTSELQSAVIDEFRERGPRDEAERLLWHELLKSQRSLANNTAESDGTQSRADFITKFHIALKEGKESLQVLQALTHCERDRREQLGRLAKQCDEIVAILVASLKTAKTNEMGGTGESCDRNVPTANPAVSDPSSRSSVLRSPFFCSSVLRSSVLPFFVLPFFRSSVLRSRS